MHPKDFEAYWKLNHVELAQLLGDYSVNGVQNWFRTDPAPVPDAVIRLLGDIHIRWSQWKLQREIIPANDRELFEMAIARQEAED